jgi:hypothetical protein
MLLLAVVALPPRALVSSCCRFWNRLARDVVDVLDDAEVDVPVVALVPVVLLVPPLRAELSSFCRLAKRLPRLVEEEPEALLVASLSRSWLSWLKKLARVESSDELLVDAPVEV